MASQQGYLRGGDSTAQLLLPRILGPVAGELIVTPQPAAETARRSASAIDTDVKLEQRGNAHHESQGAQSMRPDEQGTNSQQSAICWGEIGGSFARPVGNEELMFEYQCLCDQRPGPAGTQKLRNGDDQMDKKQERNPHAQSA